MGTSEKPGTAVKKKITLHEFINDSQSDGSILKVRLGLLLALVGENDSFGGTVSVDYSKSFYGFKSGFEVGGLPSIKTINSYTTLDGLQEIRKENSEDINFINVRLLRPFDVPLNPYLGIAYGVSNGELIHYPNLIAGIAITPISNIPFFVEVEVRRLALNVDSQEVLFNKYGNAKKYGKQKFLTGIGFVAAINYLF